MGNANNHRHAASSSKAQLHQRRSQRHDTPTSYFCEVYNLGNHLQLPQNKGRPCFLIDSLSGVGRAPLPATTDARIAPVGALAIASEGRGFNPFGGLFAEPPRPTPFAISRFQFSIFPFPPLHF
jgi:hypothetical protein